MSGPAIARQAQQHRAEAEGLAGALPAILLDARRLAGAAPGLHGRRRAGPGEAFWQFRDHRAEDGARLVDWRRSARGDRLYVRERELEAAQTAQFWIDPDPGFAWSAAPDKRPTKARRAITVALAFAILLTRGGERVSALGGPLRSGPRGAELLAYDLAAGAPAEPPRPSPRAAALYFTDGYQPAELWRERLTAAAAAGASGALVLIADPAEEDFPFEGRVQFERPDGRERVVFGRAQSARSAYAARLADQRRALRSCAAAAGFLALTHRTDAPAAPLLTLLRFGLERRG